MPGYQYEYLEWMAEQTLSDLSEVDVLLFDDSSDELDWRSELDDISTEPETGEYERQTVDVSDVSATDEDNEIQTNFDTVYFDITDTTETVDSFGLVGDIDGSETLLATGLLEQRLDLEDYTGTWPVNVGMTFTPLY